MTGSESGSWFPVVCEVPNMPGPTVQKIMIVGGGAVGLLVLLFAVSLLPDGERDVGHLKNIDGIVYPTLASGATIVTEPLAHVDVYLGQPAFAHELVLTFWYDPYELQTLSVGVRDAAFWLSYRPQVFYERAAGPAPGGRRQATVRLPLDDALQEADRSIDVMFFADTTPQEAPAAERRDEVVLWEIEDFRAQVETVWPDWRDPRDSLRVADFVVSILRRERPL